MLKLTKRSDYGLIALRHLALAVDEVSASASAKEISTTYRIPLPLLAKVLQMLAKNGFLASVQGTHGGYRLARPADRITTLEVIRAIDGPVLLTSCFTHDGGECEQFDTCTVKSPLRKIHDGILELLEATTIADLARDKGGFAPVSLIAIHPAGEMTTSMRKLTQ
jgi:Rrf2 family protein